MSGLKLAGGLCIIAGVNSAGMAFGVWEDGPIMFALALGGATVGLHRGPPDRPPRSGSRALVQRRRSRLPTRSVR